MSLHFNNLSPSTLRRISEQKRRSQFVFTGFLLAATLGINTWGAAAHDNDKAADKTQVAGADANTPPQAQGNTDPAAPVVTAKADNTDGNNGGGDAKKAADDARRADRVAQNQAANEARQAMFASRIREMLTKSGFSDTATQDAIIAHLASEEKVKSGVRDATRRLSAAIRRDVPPERMKDLITEYKAAVETERKRKEDARNALDAQIGYSKNPRLEAFLLVSGILGDGSSFRMDMMFPRQWGGPNGGPNGNGPQNGPQRGGPPFNGNAFPNGAAPINPPAATNQPYPVNGMPAIAQPAEVKPAPAAQ